MFAYSFGFFQPKDLLKIGAILTVVEGLFILLLVPLYWPLIGLPWRLTPEAQTVRPALTTPASGVYSPDPASLGAPWASGAHLPLTWVQIECRPGQCDWRSLEQHPLFVEAVRINKTVGFQVAIQGTPDESALVVWAQVPQPEVTCAWQDQALASGAVSRVPDSLWALHQRPGTALR